MLEQREIEEAAGAIYRLAGFRAGRPVSPRKLAQALLGAGAVRLVGEEVLRNQHAAVARVGAEWRIYLRRGLAPAVQFFSIGHELAEWFLMRQGVSHAEAELSADGVAAAVLAPLDYAREACAARGARWGQLALDFGSTESHAALRFGEVTREPLLLMTPTSVRQRGRVAPWPSDRALRGDRPCQGIVRTRLRDDPRRLVVRLAG